MEYKSPAIHRTPLYRAKSAYYSITQRCGNANGKNPAYKNVRVDMSLDEWLTWAIPEYEKFILQHPTERPCAGRIGDSGNYAIGNVEIISVRKNREMQKSKRSEIVHGTKSGYWKEVHRGLPTCDSCKAAVKNPGS